MSNKITEEQAEKLALGFLNHQEKLEKEYIKEFRRARGFVELPEDTETRLAIAPQADLEDRWVFVYRYETVNPRVALESGLGFVSVDKTTSQVDYEDWYSRKQK